MIVVYYWLCGEDCDICLILVLVYGINFVMVQMCGMKVVVVKFVLNGDIDFEDFVDKVVKVGEKLVVVMIIYFSMYGVFEDIVCEVCDIMYCYGGQVYIDGVNMNVMVGLVQFGVIGGDVSYLNLYKIFVILYGGGGFGMGLIGVKVYLVFFLLVDLCEVVGVVLVVLWGLVLIFLIFWVYILMMGGVGLMQVMWVVILNVNYIVSCLVGVYLVLFMGNWGCVVYECILDMCFFQVYGVIVDDIVKWLIDNGFYVLIMSFLVVGILMVELIEFEIKVEIDRLIMVFLLICDEIIDIVEGCILYEVLFLCYVFYMVEDLVVDWSCEYLCEQGCFLVGVFWVDKYWFLVGWVDNVFGDCNLICICLLLESYVEVVE